MLTDEPKISPDRVSQAEVFTKISGLYNLIGQRLGSLPEQLNMSKGDATDSGSDHSATEDSRDSSDLKARQETVKDILSVFDRKNLPEDYGEDFPREASAMTCSEKNYIPGNLAATIYGIAIRDEAFYGQLRKVVNRDICALSYFSKQWMRAREVMLSLDRYVQSGPSNAPESRDVDVPACARTLRLIVHRICSERNARASRGPLGAATGKKVAEMLVDILTEVVCNRDKDVYEEETAWKRDDEEPERKCNLYTYLIGDPPPSDASAPFVMTDDFIIDQIRNFPPMEWSHLLERLTNVLDHILDNDDEAHGSKVFAAKLESTLRDYTDEVFEPSLSSAQRRRPTATSPPASQRRRVV